MHIISAIYVTALAVGACSTALEETATLKVGETADMRSSLSIRFTGVPHDSRCPRDVQCIVAGEAHVVLEVRRDGEPEELVFEVPPGGSDRREIDGIVIAVTELEPPADSRKTIASSDYVAHVKVSTP